MTAADKALLVSVLALVLFAGALGWSIAAQNMDAYRRCQQTPGRIWRDGECRREVLQ